MDETSELHHRLHTAAETIRSLAVCRADSGAFHSGDPSVVEGSEVPTPTKTGTKRGVPVSGSAAVIEAKDEDRALFSEHMA